MKIKALFFAACRDIVGNRELDLEVGEGSQVEDLKNVLLVKYPELATINNVLSIAVNAEYVDGNAILNPGDEVAFIPPVSGG
jgi:molybdopterin synthase sulfur carrier subunit